MKIKGTCCFVQEKNGYKMYFEGKEEDPGRKSLRKLALDKEFQKNLHVCEEELYKRFVKEYVDFFYTLNDSAGDLMDGLEFLNWVRSKEFINGYGSLGFVTVDEYNSNLGLLSNNFVGGEFLVSEDVFEEICKEHEVKVFWRKL